MPLRHSCYGRRPCKSSVWLNSRFTFSSSGASKHSPESLASDFGGVNFGRPGLQKGGCPHLISPDATRPPGWKPRRRVIVATRCCGAAHGGPSLALTGCACLAGANDVRSPVAVCRTTIQPDDGKLARSIMRIETALLSKLQLRSALSRCLSPIDQTARRNTAKFRVTLRKQHTCLNLNHRLRQRYPAALDAKVARRSSALRLPAPASSTGP
jgi:hypothetical protein